MPSCHHHFVGYHSDRLMCYIECWCLGWCCIGNFGKKEQLLVTEISQYNYCHQYEERDQKFDELIAYMEYCFERQKMVTEGDELKYLTKYENNQLALDAMATEVDFHALNIYLAIRRIHGDRTEE